MDVAIGSPYITSPFPGIQDEYVRDAANSGRFALNKDGGQVFISYPKTLREAYDHGKFEPNLGIVKFLLSKNAQVSGACRDKARTLSDKGISQAIEAKLRQTTGSSGPSLAAGADPAAIRRLEEQLAAAREEALQAKTRSDELQHSLTDTRQELTLRTRRENEAQKELLATTEKLRVAEAKAASAGSDTAVQLSILQSEVEQLKATVMARDAVIRNKDVTIDALRQSSAFPAPPSNFGWQGSNINAQGIGQARHPNGLNVPAMSTESQRRSWHGGATQQVMAPQGTVSGGGQYVAVGRYVANSNDEVALSVGDVVTVERTFSDGWAQGTNTSTGRSGMFPLTHISTQPSHTGTNMRGASTAAPGGGPGSRNMGQPGSGFGVRGPPPASITRSQSSVRDVAGPPAAA